MEFTYSVQLFHKNFRMNCCTLILNKDDYILQPKVFDIGIEISSISLDDAGFVIDFGLVKCEMKKLISEFNGKVLIATQGLIDTNLFSIRISDAGNNYFSFPLKNCVLLECDCLTIQYISSIFASRIKTMLLRTKQENILSLKIMISDDDSQKVLNYPPETHQRELLGRNQKFVLTEISL